MSYIKNIQSLAEYRELIASPKLTVVDFHATWCQPCHMIAPTFNELSSKYKHANFAKVDVDQLRDVSTAAQVRSMPTFKFFKNGQQVAQLVGANGEELKRLVAQHVGSPEECGSSSLNIQGHTDINEFITLNQVDCLNLKENHVAKSIFTKDDTYIESDVDEQLLISVPFNQAVRLHSIKLVAKDIEHAPKTIKLYANRINIGFDETDSTEETQLLQLALKDYEENVIIPLRFVKFQSVTNIIVSFGVVTYNIGDQETTSLKELIFIG
ncbi:9581_t:CDS:2 [Cetraspora pellucida]|uniref:9581_t:CDS:1 n=1 Tax=Cetraspora pellucida TaxID=1433469 RepID=A0ACA9M3F9_9GLOM|nr:9581_t:CDS:2 [Cetraspora pellucida]